MKHSINRQIIGAVLLGTSLIPAASLARAAETETEMAVPATAAGIWQAIEAHLRDLRAMIAKGPLEGVHQHAYAVRDLVRELPAHSPELSAADLAKVVQQSKFVDALAKRLDQAGDTGDRPAAASNLRKLENVLKMISAHYPPPQ